MRPEIFNRESVDIIIPFHGAYKNTSKLIETILFTTRSNPYQICLVDDCSPNTHYIELLRKAPQMVVHRTPTHLGFGGALQFGFERTEQPWVIFMHSDCVISDAGWMIEMGRSLLKWREEGVPVRMVSARSNNPGGGPSQLRSNSKSHTKDIVVEEGHLPLYCAMCDRGLFNQIGGFIKNYPLAYYEDEELAFRMNKYGIKQGICGKSWVQHEGGKTISYVCKKNPKAKEIMEGNRQRCVLDMSIVKNS
jgi:GT2 family glycosyltransferase